MHLSDILEVIQIKYIQSYKYNLVSIMFQESMNNVPDLPDSNDEATNHNARQQQEVNLWIPLHTLIDTGCSRIKMELDTIQASNNTLFIERSKMAVEKNELEKKIQASNEKSCFLFMEMSRHREVVSRLESVINHLAPFLPTEKQIELADSLYRAKQFTSEDLKSLADQQIGNDLVVIPDDIHSTGHKIAEIDSAHTSLTNLMLQLLLLNANNKVKDDSTMVEDIAQNQVANVEPSNRLTWPVNNPKSQAPKRKKTTKRKIQPAKQLFSQPDEILRQSLSGSQTDLARLGVKEFKQNKAIQRKPKAFSQPEVKPIFHPEGQENNLTKQSFASQKTYKQPNLHDFFSPINKPQ